MNQTSTQALREFHEEFELFKNHRVDFELVKVFEIYLPYWFCKQTILAEKEVELDRFSKIILQTIEAGLSKHSEICNFLGVDSNSFVTIQFHFLLKNGLLKEVSIANDVEYLITSDGIAFLERKKKVPTVETVSFSFYYNELTQELIDVNSFDRATKKEEKANNSSRYLEYQTHKMAQNEGAEIIKHQTNKPTGLSTLKFADFFNRIHKDYHFYDLATTESEYHKRAVCFLALEYRDTYGVKNFDIRHTKKTTTKFKDYKLVDNLSKAVTEHYKNHD